MTGRDVRALLTLTRSLTQRMVREGMVLRSLLWPPILAGGTLLGTLMVAAALAGPAELGVTAAVDSKTRQSLAESFRLIEVSEPQRAVADEVTWAATDGQTLWVSSWGPDSDRIESVLRTHAGASWRPSAEITLPGRETSGKAGAQIIQILILLYTLYGVVFGLGMVARDQENGTLQSELTLPISRWVPGAARWLAATAILSIFGTLVVALMDALIGVHEPGAAIRNAVAACGASVTVGISVVGQSGIQRGFAGPFAVGLTAVTALVGLGSVVPSVGQWLPLASIFSEGNGWMAMIIGLGSGVAASQLFALRSAKT